MIPLTKDKIEIGLRVIRKGPGNDDHGTITRLPYNSQTLVNIFNIKWDRYSTDMVYFVDDCDKRFCIIFDPIRDIHNQNNVRQEKPCRLCQRKNDIGVTVCWSCGNHP